VGGDVPLSDLRKKKDLIKQGKGLPLKKEKNRKSQRGEGGRIGVVRRCQEGESGSREH